MSRQIASPPPINPPAGTPGSRSLGTSSTQAAPGDDGRFTSNIANTLATVTAMRAVTVTPIANSVWKTNGRFAAGDGGDWAYRWDSVSTATDDGCLVIQATAIVTGRFLAIRPENGLLSARACGPAAADGSRSVSFDPTGVVDIGTELYRISQILARAGWAGLRFVGGSYSCATNLKIAPRVKGKGFSILAVGGATFVGPAITSAPTAIGFYARGKSEVEASAPGQLFTTGYRSQTWTQTLVGGELTMTGVAQVAGSATVKPVVGDICVLRIGAEQRDAGGWSSSSYFAEVTTITPTTGNSANLTFKDSLPVVPPVGAGINPSRIQTQHDLVIIDTEGFQDELVLDGLILDNVFLTGAYDRNTRIRARWLQTNIGINTTGSQGMTIDAWFDWSTGYGGGHYGAPIILQACVGTTIERIKGTFNVDTIIDHELSCRGTKVGLMDTSWDARGTGTGTVNLITAEEFPTLVQHLMLHGGYGSVGLSPTVSVGLLTAWNSDVTVISVRANNCGAISFNGVLYKDKKRFSIVAMLTPSTTTDIQLPIKGLFRSIRVKTSASSATGITSADWIVNSSFSRGSTFTQWVANQWNDDGTAAVLYGSYNVSRHTGYHDVKLRVGCDGTLPSGTIIYIEGEVFVPELAIVTSVADTSYPPTIGGSGPPSANADFIGQGYIDFTSSPRRHYIATSMGSGSADWDGGGTTAVTPRWKDPVVVATTANGTLASAFANGQTVDGYTLVTGDRILLKNQTAGAENGIYTVNASGAPTRATDADTGAELVQAVVGVTKGTAGLDKFYVCTNDSITIGSTAQTWVLLPLASGALIAASNLSDLVNAGTARTNLGMTVAGSNWVTAADVAAQTAILNAATTSLKGLMSAADKTKFDAGVPDIIDDHAAATGTGSYSTPTWTAGTYRVLELELTMEVTSGTAGFSTIDLVGTGITGTPQTTVNYSTSTTTVGAVTSPTLYLGLSGGAGSDAYGSFKIYIKTGAKRRLVGTSELFINSTYTQTQSHGGSHPDTTHDVTGLTINFLGTTGPWTLLLKGYK